MHIIFLGHRRRIMNNIKQIITKEPKSGEALSGARKNHDDRHHEPSSEEGIYQFPTSYNASNLPGISGIERNDRDNSRDVGLSRADSMFGTVNYNTDSLNTSDQYDSLDRNRELSRAPQKNEINHSVHLPKSHEDLIYDSPPRSQYYGRNNTETEEAYQCPAPFGERSQSTVETWNRPEDTGVTLQYETSESLPLPLTLDSFLRGNFENDRSIKATDLSDTCRGVNSMTDQSMVGKDIQGQGNNFLSTNPPRPVPRKRSTTPTDPSKYNADTHVSQTDENKQKSLLSQNEYFKTRKYENVERSVIAEPQPSLTDDCDSNFLDSDTSESVYEIFTQNLKRHSVSMQQNLGLLQSLPETDTVQSLQQAIGHIDDTGDESGVYKRLQAPRPVDNNQQRGAFTDFDDEYNLLDRSSLSNPPMYPQPSQESHYDFPPRQCTLEEDPVSNYDYPPPQRTQEDPELNYDYPPQQYPQQSPELSYNFPQLIQNQLSKPPAPSNDLYHEASFVGDEYDNSDSLNINGLAIQEKKQTLPADVEEEDTYEDTNFPISVASQSHSSPVPPTRSRNRIFSEQVSYLYPFYKVMIGFTSVTVCQLLHC